MMSNDLVVTKEGLYIINWLIEKFDCPVIISRNCSAVFKYFINDGKIEEKLDMLFSIGNHLGQLDGTLQEAYTTFYINMPQNIEKKISHKYATNYSVKFDDIIEATFEKIINEKPSAIALRQIPEIIYPSIDWNENEIGGDKSPVIDVPIISIYARLALIYADRGNGNDN